MAAPQLTQYINGQSAPVTADNFNTFMQTCDNISELRAFTGIQGIQVYLRGITTPADGGQGTFYWNASSSAADDGVNTIVPTGSALGAWIRLSTDTVSGSNDISYIYQYAVPLTGFSIQINNETGSLILNPAGTLATGTIILPVAPINGQLLRIASTQIITALTMTAPASQHLLNAVSSLTAGGGGVVYQYLGTLATWFRV